MKRDVQVLLADVRCLLRRMLTKLPPARLLSQIFGAHIRRRFPCTTRGVRYGWVLKALPARATQSARPSDAPLFDPQVQQDGNRFLQLFLTVFVAYRTQNRGRELALQCQDFRLRCRSFLVDRRAQRRSNPFLMLWLQ